MTRATSKASLLTTKENGQDTAQQDKILEILSDNKERSMQEIMREYRSRFGNIELSSVSARCNKLKELGKIREFSPRKCTVSGRTINPVGISAIEWVQGGKYYIHSKSRVFYISKCLQKGKPIYTAWHKGEPIKYTKKLDEAKKACEGVL